jgi:hypothetical protein
MYRIKVTGCVKYLEDEDPKTSLQRRDYGPDFDKFAYRNAFRDVSVLERDFATEEAARLAMAKSYNGIDDYGLGFTWTVVRQGSIVVRGAEAIDYVDRKGETYMRSAIKANRIARWTLREHSSSSKPNRTGFIQPLIRTTSPNSSLSTRREGS